MRCALLVKGMGNRLWFPIYFDLCRVRPTLLDNVSLREPWDECNEGGIDTSKDHNPGREEERRNAEDGTRGIHKNKYENDPVAREKAQMPMQCKQKTAAQTMDLSDLTCPSVGMQQGPSIGSSKGADLDPTYFLFRLTKF